MLLHLVRCEMCKQEFQFFPQLRSFERMPGTWFTVFQGKDIQAQEGWHLCSLQCLLDWAANSLAANHEHPLSHPSLAHIGDVGPNERAYFQEHEPYPGCCAKHCPAGE